MGCRRARVSRRLNAPTSCYASPLVDSAEAQESCRGPALVTGGTGFLGRRIVDRLLALGRKVTVAARRPAPDLEARGVRFIRVELEDATGVREACRGMETVFHVAAKVGVWGSRADFHRANVLGTRAVLDCCKAHGVRRLVHTSTPSVVYNGRDLSGADESLPLTTDCPSPYPLTKAEAEAEVLGAHGVALRTVALRPHLIWGPGDPHLVPRILERARSGRLRIVGEGRNRVDMVHVENAADAHLLAERALSRKECRVGGRAYFITNGEPVVLWDWINGLLAALGRPFAPSDALKAPAATHQVPSIDYQQAWMRRLLSMNCAQVLICQCEEVTREALLAVRQPAYLGPPSAGMARRDFATLLGDGPANQDQIKRLTRACMGPCQARRCREQVALALACAGNESAARIPLAGYRAPVRPLPLSVLADWEEARAMSSHWDVWLGIPTQWVPYADIGTDRELLHAGVLGGGPDE